MRGVRGPSPSGPLARSDRWTEQGQLGPNRTPWGLPRSVVAGEPAAEECYWAVMGTPSRAGERIGDMGQGGVP